MVEPIPFQRPVAIQVTLKDILEGEVQQEETGTFLLFREGTSVEKKHARLNVMATILQKEALGTMTQFLVDDGTGSALLRFFEKSPRLENFAVGETVLLVGKVRIYNGEKYLSPEIMKKISPVWLKVRALQLRGKNKRDGIMKTPEKKSTQTEEKKNSHSEEEALETEEQLPLQKIIALIKELDTGEGAPLQEIIEKSPMQDTEFLLERMMERGEIFQVLPGRVKVL